MTQLRIAILSVGDELVLRFGHVEAVFVHQRNPGDLHAPQLEAGEHHVEDAQPIIEDPPQGVVGLLDGPARGD